MDSFPAKERSGIPLTGIWIVLVVGFSLLVILIAFSGFTALQRANEIHASIAALHEADHQTEEVLGRLRSDVQISAIAVRDFLLDPSADAGTARAEMHRLQDSTTSSLDKLQPLTRPQDAAEYGRMRGEVDEYWRSLDPLFTWTAAQRAGSSTFLRSQVLPKREAALDLVRRVEELTASGIRQRSDEIERRQANLPGYVERVIGATILVGMLIALVSILQIVRLERLAAVQHEKVRDAEKELRKLSQQLVHAQEEERRSLSRELHDQIGQLLTAVRIGIGNLEEALGVCPDRVQQQLDQSRRIVEQVLRSVRDLAMGLRPAMLDDLGLGAALEWQARQHARLCGVPVTVNLDGELNGLSDEQRTCVYRVVQEALNNVAKHAGATDILVEVANRNGLLSILVRDNGRGFDIAGQAVKGLGIVGMKERVRQLGGQLMMESSAGQGVTLAAVIPLGGLPVDAASIGMSVNRVSADRIGAERMSPTTSI
ncbi:MAG TPA: sensor histidine kinase [Bryobacteraceae bacterium]|jgi:signal transduction histidine kinase|nr:sensor histidine kinase [Bryobacteraceae bacterium]